MTIPMTTPGLFTKDWHRKRIAALAAHPHFFDIERTLDETAARHRIRSQRWHDALTLVHWDAFRARDWDAFQAREKRRK